MCIQINFIPIFQSINKPFSNQIDQLHNLLISLPKYMINYVYKYMIIQFTRNNCLISISSLIGRI